MQKIIELEEDVEIEESNPLPVREGKIKYSDRSCGGLGNDQQTLTTLDSEGHDVRNPHEVGF